LATLIENLGLDELKEKNKIKMAYWIEITMVAF
jgi:hypothetical protein